jgi:hypothetical protein
MTSSSIRIGLTTLVCVLALLSAVVDAKEIPKEEASNGLKRLKPVPQLPTNKRDQAKAQSKTAATPYILSDVPINIAVYEGDNVTFNCAAVNDSFYRIQWWEFAYNSAGNIISDGDEMVSHPESARYSIVKPTPQTYNLHIRDVRLEDAGTYLCEDVYNGPPTVYRGAAQLIVIEATPNCTTTLADDGVVIEGQYYTAECTLTYNGDIVPLQSWSGPDPHNVGSSEVPNSIWSGVSWIANRSMEAQVFQCLHNFTNNFIPDSDEGSDVVPTWSYVYQTNQMFVYWGPTNMYVETIKEYYVVGDVLTCYADAYPSASYQWQNMRTNEIFHSQSFQVTADLLGTTQQVRCQAQNNIQGFIYSGNIVVNVTVLELTTVEITAAPTTTLPAVSACFDLSGRWESTESIAATLCLTIDESANGHTVGLFRNDTDTYWLEIVGRAEIETYEHIGFAGIWPGVLGVSGFVGECHRCNGVEVLLINDIQRTKGRDQCSEAGPLHYSPQYTFYRTGLSCVTSA